MKKHPKGQAQKIRTFSGDFVGWSIYPDQVAAMERRMTKVLRLADPLVGSSCSRLIVRSQLEAIGIKGVKQ